ncbi:hypothetical protein [Spelaeicoccus albus]|uniref:Uncharacterized protein n=1 Tax=Spelaeicoccus albus TaxID=1280376 RepID=A0A7Z0D4Y3_9MICO|nr:hypothetical protein [Spelaeicoccus albus]NYI68904.1 hypothetical protein [Spelaeicoccus albus]
MKSSLLLQAAEEAERQLPMPSWAFGVIAFIVFLVLLGITLSWRGISHRH